MYPGGATRRTKGAGIPEEELDAILQPFRGAPLPAQEAEAVLKLKNEIIDLQNKGTLAFKDFTLCSNVLGFGSYVPFEQPAVPEGGELLLYYEPVNVFTNRVKGSTRSGTPRTSRCSPSRERCSTTRRSCSPSTT